MAGHQDLATTQRYMHLSPAALDAIRLLEQSRPAEAGHYVRGDILETTEQRSVKSLSKKSLSGGVLFSMNYGYVTA